MDALVQALGGVVAVTGVHGAIAIAVVVGLVAAVILFARTTGLFSEVRTASQQSDFQKNLLDAVERLTKIEGSLRDELDQMRNDKAALQKALAEATVSIELMRHQQRRIIDLFRDVLAGRRDPSSIDLHELGHGA